MAKLPDGRQCLIDSSSAYTFACQRLQLGVGLRCVTYAGGSFCFGLSLSVSVLSCVGLGLVLFRVDLAILDSVFGGGGVNVRPNSNTQFVY